MTSLVDDTVRGVVGAALILRSDARGLGAFDLSLDGFFRSFFAAVVVLPVFAVVHLLQSRQAGLEATPLTIAVFAYVLQWLVFPFTAAVLAKLMRRGEYFVAYVIATNWASIVQIAIVFAVVLVAATLPGELGSLLLLAMTLGLLYYDYLVARFAFDAEGLDGVAVVIVQLMVGMAVHRLVTGG